MIALMLFIFGLLAGQLGPSAWNWIRITLLLTSAVGLFIVATVPDHFLEKHLWEHIAKQHVPRTFAWTFSALLLVSWARSAFFLRPKGRHSIKKCLCRPTGTKNMQRD